MQHRASSFRSQPIEVYDPIRKSFSELVTPDIFGVPESTVNAIMQLVDTANPPLRLLLGKIAYPAVKKAYEDRLASFEQWKEVSATAHGN